MNMKIKSLSNLYSEKLNELALFAGAGGGILGSHLLGWNTVCAVERDAYAAQVLAQRQNDGILKPFPIWSDIASFDGKPWKRIVDVISGGFPCQDISSAGKGAGIDGERSGLWSEMARIVSEVRPKFVFVENSPMLVGRGLARVISDLAQMGYVMQWTRFSASNFGAPHQRDRLWLVANSTCNRVEKECESGRFKQKVHQPGKSSSCLANTKSIGWEQARKSQQSSSKWIAGQSDEFPNPPSFGSQRPRTYWYACDPAENQERETDRTFYERIGYIWGIKSRLGRVANGVPHRVDRLKAIGNAQVPYVATSAFKFLASIVHQELQYEDI